MDPEYGVVEQKKIGDKIGEVGPWGMSSSFTEMGGEHHWGQGYSRRIMFV